MSNVGRLVVDVHERELQNILKSYKIPFSTLSLVVGDIFIETPSGLQLTIERKTLPDFVQSMMDGRLDNQMAVLQTVEHPFLLVEMSGKIFSKINRRAIFAKMAKLSLSRVRIIPVRNIHDSVGVISYFLRLNEDIRIDFIRPKQGVTKTDVHEQRIFVLTGFPGIGRKRAEKLLEKYGSLREALKHIEDDEILPRNVRESAKRVLG